MVESDAVAVLQHVQADVSCCMLVLRSHFTGGARSSTVDSVLRPYFCSAGLVLLLLKLYTSMVTGEFSSPFVTAAFWSCTAVLCVAKSRSGQLVSVSVQRVCCCVVH
jgi:hypothetical protein